jgi:hypothetical protein
VDGGCLDRAFAKSIVKFLPLPAVADALPSSAEAVEGSQSNCDATARSA